MPGTALKDMQVQDEETFDQMLGHSINDNMSKFELTINNQKPP